jgi:hypothetical protein
MNLVSLVDEQLIRVLSFLRATEIAAVRISCARFNEYVVSEVRKRLLACCLRGDTLHKRC